MKPIRMCRVVVWLAVLCLFGCENRQDDSPFMSEELAPMPAESFSNEREVAQQRSGHSAAAPQHPANRLGRETSPYLLLHAHNPVDWYPWGSEAFETARREGKPVFLSVGYSSCYWCHVMERMVFSNPEIARYMNDHFVNIKVDREERPDVDDIYMTALTIYFQMSGIPQGGGWPLSMFLTPTGQPIAGGTYFPPEDQGGRPGFGTVMKRIVDAWELHRETVEKNAGILAGYVRQATRPRHDLPSVSLAPSLVTAALEAVKAGYDPEYGGVDFDPGNPSAPKFPSPTKLTLLQHETGVRTDGQSAQVLLHTLDRMASGGIYDHLGGGFHRYSTDRTWNVPHFEKMLYDNAQLADVYVDAYRQTGKATYRDVAEGIFAFVAREMTDSAGGFYSALDAETDAVEGKFYVWAAEEIDALLSDAGAGLFRRAFGVVDRPDFEYGNVLHRAMSPEELVAEFAIDPVTLTQELDSMRQRLLIARERRQRPLRDDKVLTSWNGLMIRALANASPVLGRSEYVTTAEQAATFILTQMRDEQGRLHRTYRARTAKLNAYLDDYAFVIEGLLALHRATRDDKWLDLARELTDDQIRLFWDEEGKGFFFTAHHHEELLARTKNAYDSVLPSGNSVTVRNLIRLAALTGESRYRQYAQETLELFAPTLKQSPGGMTNMALATAEFLESPDSRGNWMPISDSAANSPAATPREPAQAAAGSTLQTIARGSTEPGTAEEFVTAAVYLSVDKLPAGGDCHMAVLLNIKDGWHINANPAMPDFLVPTTVTLKSKHGVQLVNVRYPAGKPLHVEEHDVPLLVYDGRVVISAGVRIPVAAAGKTDELELEVRYQACNDQMCQRPARITLTGQVPVAQPGESVREVNASLFQSR